MFTKQELKAIERVFEYVNEITGLSDNEDQILVKVKKEINKEIVDCS